MIFVAHDVEVILEKLLFYRGLFLCIACVTMMPIQG